MEATMDCMSLAVLPFLFLTAVPQPDESAPRVPQNFAKRADIAAGAPALFIMEWLIAPGLEAIDDLSREIPEFKFFPAEVAKVLRSHDVQSRSAALKYLATLAGTVRTCAWWRDRDDKADLFQAALGRHAGTMRVGLESAFKDTTGNDRVLAAVALLALADNHAQAVDCIVDALRSKDAARREEVCSLVGRVRLSHPQLVAALAAATTDSDLKVRRSAASALLVAGPNAASAAPAMLAYLKNDDATTDETLIEMGVAPMILWQTNRQCMAIGESLADLKPAVPAVVELLNVGGANRRQIAFACLAQLGPQARGALKELPPYLVDQDDHTRLTAAATILCIDPDHPAAATVLVSAMESKDAKLRECAVTVCADLTPKVNALVPPLIAALKENSEPACLNAMRALARMGPAAEPAIPHLASLLPCRHDDDSDQRIQYNAACALVAIGKSGLDALMQTLQRRRDPRVSMAVLFALGACKKEGATVVPLLVRALDDNDPAVRMQAAAALGRLKQAAAPARDALLRASQRIDRYDTFGASRTLACWALTQLTR
jgi:HEAT repeat protein